METQIDGDIHVCTARHRLLMPSERTGLKFVNLFVVLNYFELGQAVVKHTFHPSTWEAGSSL